MNIIEIIPQLSSGGAERFVVDLCNELSERHTVTLVILHKLDNNNFYLDEMHQNVNVISMNKHMGVDLMLPFRLMKVVKKINPDIVHTHLRAIVYCILSTLFNHRPVYFHTVHNTADKEAGGLISRFVRKFLFKFHLSKPITISEESHRSFVDYYGIDASMIYNGRNIPNHLQVSKNVIEEINHLKHSEHTRIMICLARVNSVKRQALLAKVSAQLKVEGYDFMILSIGNIKDGKYVEEVKAQASDNLILLGERKNPLEYLKAAGAYVLCSSYEGMPISLIEALGVGAVPICTPVGGMVNVVKDGINGFLASDLSENACYYLIKRYLETSDEMLQNIKIKALESYKPYSMTECAKRYESLFIEES